MNFTKKITLATLFQILFFGQIFSQNSPENFNIIPRPISISPKPGEFILNAETLIFSPKNSDWQNAVEQLVSVFQPSTGFQFSAQVLKKELSLARGNAIYFIEDESVKHPEGYQLEVQTDKIYVRARSAAGAFYAVQTLRQLFPPEINSPDLQANMVWKTPCCLIDDAPRFSWRGMHLDVGRHFFEVDFIKKYIDQLAAHKMNVFHWHLTEDQGWRIEIQKYPKLQTVAACRNETLLGIYSDSPERYDGQKYCGFYTREQIKEVLEYAKKRFVTVVPEIELPGHAQAALSAFPELGCTGGPYLAATKWGVFHEVFCAGNEKTFEFLENVLDEVAKIFPGQYIHIGGDECPKSRWRECPKCQKRMKDNRLKDEHELQSYFIRRVEKMLTKRGKKVIGWDEILEGGLAPTAAVMSWRGTEGGIAAAKQHHEVVMTPTSHCYFDYYQSDPDSEPLAIGGFLPIEKVYSYEPVPAELTADEAKYIIGTQGNLWSEYIPNPEKVEYMVWPRACATAEIAWSAKNLKDFGDFSRRLVGHFEMMKAMKINFSKAFFDVSAEFLDGKINLKSNAVGAEIRYTTDGSEPRRDDKVFSKPFVLEAKMRDFKTIRAAVFQNGEKSGKTFTQTYQLSLSTGKPYTLSKQPEKYTGGEKYALTNGISGSFKKWNLWVANEGADLDPTIDLGTEQKISRLTTHFVNARDAWIYPPRSLEVFVSDDGKTFKSIARREFSGEKFADNAVERVVLDLPEGTLARFVQVVATNFGKIPPGSAGEGNASWLFLDEIVIE